MKFVKSYLIFDDSILALRMFVVSQYYSLKMFTLLVLFVLCSTECVLSSNQCSKKSNFKYDISDGHKEGSAIIKDGVRYEKQNYYSEGSVVWGCVCDVSKCIRKCCAEGQYPLKTNDSRICTPLPPDQVRSLSDGLKSKAETKDYNVVHGGIICNTELSLALPATNLKKDLHDGILDAYDMKFDYNEFCLDYVRNKLTSIICVNSDEQKYINSVGKYSNVNSSNFNYRDKNYYALGIDKTNRILKCFYILVQKREDIFQVVRQK
ncbi:hypothetical protein WA026_012946 [Henosepilachna vigintioctopunctata]|uniref:Methuselah N-terminal domain-containing protein n=1 Tax=Henosepilachna vigintioctopunctata TaxID=420089 RepID=A0AAW1TLI6_9CUCU